MTPPRVTVLIPVYGGERYIGAAVASVLEQSFSDLELLLVDDCGPDGSIAIAESFGDPRLRVLSNETNLGQVVSLNRGLEAAQGEFVARLDQDDVCLPDRIARQVEVLEQQPSVDLVATWMEIAEDGGGKVGALRGEIDSYVEFVYRVLVDGLPIAHPTVMFRRLRILELGGYDEKVRYAEDKDLWRRLALARGDARVIPESLVRYRVHEAQQSNTHANEQRRNDRQSLERFIGALTTRPTRPLQLLLALDPALWKECDSVEQLVDDLDDLVKGAVAALLLDAQEAAELTRLLHRRADRAARRAWRTGNAQQGRSVSRAARQRLTPRERVVSVGASAASSVLAPLLRPMRTAFRRVRPERDWTHLGG